MRSRRRFGPDRDDRMLAVEMSAQQGNVRKGWVVGICVNCDTLFQSEFLRELCGHCARWEREWIGLPPNERVD